MVHEGETVEMGQTLIVMEAMKMEIRITAPADGKIAKLHVQQGDTVDRGQLLVEVGVS
jgi:biotin carboxyl carrier protein